MQSSPQTIMGFIRLKVSMFVLETVDMLRQLLRGGKRRK